MRKSFFISLLMLFCVLAYAQNFKFTGKIGEDEASFELKKTGDSVQDKVLPCSYCIPIELKGTWVGDTITLSGRSEAGSIMNYKLTVEGDTVKGTESLMAEGEEELQEITMTISKAQ
jgi:hypothetical protein